MFASNEAALPNYGRIDREEKAVNVFDIFGNFGCVAYSSFTINTNMVTIFRFWFLSFFHLKNAKRIILFSTKDCTL